MSHNLIINGIEFPSVGKLLIPDSDGNKIEFVDSDSAQIPDGYILPTGSKTITSNGEYDVSAFAKALVNVSGQYYVSQWKPSANTHTVSFNTAFEPKLFIITSVNNVIYDTSNVYYVAALWHCSELTGDGYGQYSGGLTPGYGASSRPQAASYDARSYYSYSNGVVSINDATHYFRSGLFYRIFAMA